MALVDVLRAVDPLDGGPGGPTRHDLVLAVIPTAFVVAALVGGLAGVPARTAVGAAAGVGALAMLDALFFNPPRGPTTGPRT